MGRQQVQWQHSVLPIWLLPLRGVPDPAHNKLLDITPDEVWAVLMHNGDGNAALDALVEQVGADTGHVLTVIHRRGHIPGADKETVTLETVWVLGICEEKSYGN